jgi:hypothetical protein
LNAAIYLKYVNSGTYPYKRFQLNFKSLLDDFREKKGLFDPRLEEADIPRWYTSEKQQSDGYILLMYLWRHREAEMVTMTAEQIWQSHPEFSTLQSEEIQRIQLQVSYWSCWFSCTIF